MAGELREPLLSRFKMLSLTSSKNWAPSPDDPKLYGVHMPLAIETTDPNTVTKACTNPYCFFSAAYHSRMSNLFFDDTNNKDEWQTAVYAYTRALVDEIGAISVADVGCGSGFKLVSFFGDMLTVGYDLEPTLSYLRKAYPGHAWLESNLDESFHPMPVDVVISADVIEHIPDTDKYLAMLKRFCARYYVVSTPDRARPGHLSEEGPPKNNAHVREWHHDELAAYFAYHGFNVLASRENRPGSNQNTMWFLLELDRVG